MAQKLTQRDTIDAIATDDLIHVVNVSNTTDDAAGSSEKATFTQVLAFVDANASFITEVSEDTTPVLGGNLDAGDYDITGLNDLEFSGDPSEFRTTAGFGAVNFNAYDNNTEGYVMVARMESSFGVSFTVYDATFVIADSVDTTKKALFDASLIGTSTSRTYQFPNKSGILAITSDFTFNTTATISVTGTYATYSFNVVDNSISDAKLRQSAGLSVVGRSASTTGNVADITAGTDHQVLRRSGTSIGFGAVDLAQADATVNSLLVSRGGTGRASHSAYGLIAGATTTTGAQVSLSNGTTGHFLKSQGASAYPTFAALTASDVSDFDTEVSNNTTVVSKLDKSLTIQTKSGNYTLQESDNGSYMRFTATATLTLPNSLSTGFSCIIVNASASDVLTLSASTTLISKGSLVEIANGGGSTVTHLGSNVWEALGDLE